MTPASSPTAPWSSTTHASAAAPSRSFSSHSFRLPLLILGSTPAADALADVAAAAGYEISRSPAGSAAELSRAAGLVVASHGRDEEAGLAEALLAGVPSWPWWPAPWG